MERIKAILTAQLSGHRWKFQAKVMLEGFLFVCFLVFGFFVLFCFVSCLLIEFVNSLDCTGISKVKYIKLSFPDVFVFSYTL